MHGSALAPELTAVTAVTVCDLLPGLCACPKATYCHHSFIRQKESASSLQVSLSYISYGIHDYYRSGSIILFSISIMNLGDYIYMCVLIMWIFHTLLKTSNQKIFLILEHES